MFVSGHEDILNDVFKILPKDYFSLTNIYKFFNKDKVFKGLNYVDLPCGVYELTNDKKHYIFHSKTLCYSLKILSILNDVPTSDSVNIFHYHRGHFAYLHSMTTDPENTNRKIRDKIVIAVIGYALLALYDDKIYDKNIYPNAMWMGFILHIITDSYSPSHTIRSNKLSYYIVDKSKQKDLKTYENIKYLARQNRVYKYSSFGNKRDYDTYKLLKFNFDINKIAIKYKIKRIKEPKTYTEGDIISFQYSPNQPLLMHQRLDLLSVVKNNKRVYKKMLDECCDLLNIYKEVLMTHDIKKYMHDIQHLMLNRVFKMTTNNLDSKSNKIYKLY
jgi:hypothetical protein